LQWFGRTIAVLVAWWLRASSPSSDSWLISSLAPCCFSFVLMLPVVVVREVSDSRSRDARFSACAAASLLRASCPSSNPSSLSWVPSRFSSRRMPLSADNCLYANSWPMSRIHGAPAHPVRIQSDTPAGTGAAGCRPVELFNAMLKLSTDAACSRNTGHPTAANRNVGRVGGSALVRYAAEPIARLSNHRNDLH
jgi:hypothetical protein